MSPCRQHAAAAPARPAPPIRGGGRAGMSARVTGAGTRELLPQIGDERRHLPPASASPSSVQRRRLGAALLGERVERRGEAGVAGLPSSAGFAPARRRCRPTALPRAPRTPACSAASAGRRRVAAGRSCPRAAPVRRRSPRASAAGPSGTKSSIQRTPATPVDRARAAARSVAAASEVRRQHVQRVGRGVGIAREIAIGLHRLGRAGSAG